MKTSRALALIAAVAVVPRLAILLHERGTILAQYTEKNDTFASVFVHSGTFGLIPGIPSAYTQPLYAFFLIPIYWIFGRHWEAVGVAQILVAVATAFVVYAIGRRFVSPRVGLIGALIATLNPYLLWHDVHVNREILDGVLAASLVFLTMLVAEKPRRARLGAALGLVLGVAVLGNARLLALTVVLALFLLWQAGRAVWGSIALLFVGTAIVVLPWMIRNDVSVGCFTITTDARALWKANNVNTYSVLAHGGALDDVPAIPGAPPTPQDAASIYESQHRIVKVDECAQMRFYQRRAERFVLHHPLTKLHLAVQAMGMLWDPRSVLTIGRSERGTFVDTARRWVEPLYAIPLFVLGAIGFFLLPRRLAYLLVTMLAYQTLAAAAFAGFTRYRVPWDFTFALGAAATLSWLAERVRTGSAGASLYSPP
jgi:4-amino-4-deoxy-L-arabinose transferase-like glycosyltransferase